jgi:hypothetical protein
LRRREENPAESAEFIVSGRNGAGAGRRAESSSASRIDRRADTETYGKIRTFHSSASRIALTGARVAQHGAGLSETLAAKAPSMLGLSRLADRSKAEMDIG